MRVTFNVGEPLLNKIDKYADACGVTRSAFCSMLVSQGIMSYEKSFEILDSLKETMPDKLQDLLGKNIKVE